MYLGFRPEITEDRICCYRITDFVRCVKIIIYFESCLFQFVIFFLVELL